MTPEEFRQLTAHRESRRRVTTSLVGLALASGAIGLAVVAFRGGESSRPSGDPVPGPSSSPHLWTGPGPEPILDIEFGDVYRSSDSYVLGQACCPILDTSWLAGLLMDTADVRFHPTLMISIGPAAPGTHLTRILFLPERRAAAEELRNEVFPGAEMRVGRPRYDHDIEIALGADFAERHRFELDAVAHVHGFLTRREKGRGAEPYISEDVAARYHRGEDGLSLYRYATLPTMDFEQLKLAVNGGVVEMALVPIWGETAYMDDTGPLVEILQVGWVEGSGAAGGRRLTIVGVHRDTFPFP